VGYDFLELRKITAHVIQSSCYAQKPVTNCLSYGTTYGNCWQFVGSMYNWPADQCIWQRMEW